MNIKQKKLLLIIVSAVLAVTILAVGTILVIKNVGPTVLSIESKTALKGDTVILPMNIDKNHGLYYGVITVKYNASALSFVSCANGEVFDECETSFEDGEVKIIVNQELTNDKNTRKDGVVATLKFEISDKAANGDYLISFVDEEDVSLDTEFCRVKNPEEIIVPELEAGTITVK